MVPIFSLGSSYFLLLLCYFKSFSLTLMCPLTIFLWYNNLLLAIPFKISYFFEWLGPTGLCNLSSLTHRMCFAWSNLLQHQIYIVKMQYKVQDNLALLPVVRNVVARNFSSISGKTNINFLAALFTTT